MINSESHPELEGEFYEDFSGWEITSKDLDEVLEEARSVGDVRLGRLVKHLRYLHFLMPSLLKIAERAEPGNTFVKLSEAALGSGAIPKGRS